MSKFVILELIFTLFSLFRSVLTEFDYCSIHCVAENINIQHIICKRQNQCSLPDVDCLNFQNTSLTSSEQELILDEHNTLRNSIALGENSNNITAANMNELKWNAELEYIALCVVNTCWEYLKGNQLCVDTKDLKSGTNIASKRISVANNNLGSPEILKEHIRGWYSEIVSLSEAKVNKFSLDNSTKIQRVSQIIWAETTSIGCARSIYGQYTTMFACIYSPAGNINGKPIFVKGAPCSRCEYGVCSPSYNGLCTVLEFKRKFPLNTTTITTTITTTLTNTLTTTIGSTTISSKILLGNNASKILRSDHKILLSERKRKAVGGSDRLSGRTFSNIMFVVLHILWII